MKLEINYKKKIGKNNHKLWRLTNMLLNNLKITEEIKQEIKNTWGQMKQKHNIPKSMECNKSSSKREVYRDIGLPQKIRKISNLILQLKELEKEGQSSKVVEGRK